MGLPRGRRWVDAPRKPWPNAGRAMAAVQAALADPRPLGCDPLAVRTQAWIDAERDRRRQGELRLGSGS